MCCGAIVSKSDLFDHARNLTLLRVGARMCPLTCKLIAATFEDLMSVKGPHLADFPTFLATMQDTPLGVPAATCWHILGLFEETNASPKNQVENAQHLLRFSINCDWVWGVLKALRQRGMDQYLPSAIDYHGDVRTSRSDASSHTCWEAATHGRSH